MLPFLRKPSEARAKKGNRDRVIKMVICEALMVKPDLQ